MGKVESATKMNGDALWQRRRFSEMALDCAIAVIAIVPLLLTKHLPLGDLPNHLARQYILRDISDSQVLQTFYEVHWALVPNLALELFVSCAGRLISIDLAVRAFCVATILMLFFGTRLVNRSLGGERSRIYRVAPLLCYGGPFQFGFLSFCFGVGLALVLFGYYLRFRSVPVARLAAIFAPCSFVLLLCHLGAFGVFAVAVGSTELSSVLATFDGSARRLLTGVLGLLGRAGLCLLPAAVLYVAFSPTAGAGNGSRLSTVWQKAEGIAAITLFSSPVMELALLGLAFAGLVAALYLKAVKFHRDTAIGMIVFAIVWLILPRVALGGGFIDYRIPWAASFFMVSGLVPDLRYERLALWFGTAFGALALTRIALIAWLWLSWEPTMAAIDDALGTLPIGARLMVVEGQPASISASRRPPLDHVAAYAVARRQGFEPSVFASFPGQILYFKEPYRKLWILVNPSRLDHLAPEYNYVLVLRPALTRISPLLALTCEKSGPEFELLKLVSSQRTFSPAERRGRCSG